MEKQIIIKGACEHNLKNADVVIPHNKLTVVTGVSGSGKSSLVFDTLYREGQRRFLESLSAYSRHLIGKTFKPEAESFEGILPAIAVKQGSMIRSPKSTVGTISGLYDYLRLLFARIGKPVEEIDIKLSRALFSFNSPYGYCPECKGTGLTDQIAVHLIVGDERKSLREGALNLTTPNGYIIYSQVTMDSLDMVCKAHGFNVDIPWKDLKEEEKHIVLYGSDKVI
ncbi:MAG: excinuclease ABC subunit UvrA, partial [Bacteroidales bacterium]|nr:excinuclease ABC subunit UvrA [Bacteroidales bacterium]